MDHVWIYRKQTCRGGGGGGGGLSFFFLFVRCRLETGLRKYLFLFHLYAIPKMNVNNNDEAKLAVLQESVVGFEQL